MRVDPKLKTLVEKHRCDVFTPEGLREVVEPFEKLTSGIIGQQVRSVTSLVVCLEELRCCGLLETRKGDVMHCAIWILTSSHSNPEQLRY